MTDRNFELTRRKALAGLATVGAAGAGAGLGTSALFSDTESFLNNSLQAGTLDLVVDYYTSTDQGSFGSSSQSGEVNGDLAAEYTYTVSDVKPGDSGTVAFCPKLVTNPGWLWVGSAGVTDYENGQTEPEGGVDASGGGFLSGGNDGAGAGELSDAMEVTVSYAGSVSYDSDADEITCNDTRELNNPEGYTLADLAKDLKTGVPLDGNEPNDGDGSVDPYPGSSGPDDQQGPCICIEWEVPTDTGNEIQSDAIEFGFEFIAQQARNNADPPNPFVDTVVESGDSIQAAINAASSGDVIAVGSGTFEPVTIGTSGVTLAAIPGTSPTIDGGGSNAAVSITEDNVTVDGFNVSNSGGLLGIQVGTDVDGATICNNRIHSVGPTGEFGVTGINITTGEHRNITIVRNVIEGLRQEINENGGFPTLNGILFDADGGPDTLTDATIAHNTIRDLESDIAPLGIVLAQNPHDVRIANNSISDFRAAHEVDSDDSDDASGEFTTFAQGISLDGFPSGSNVQITENVISENIDSEDGFFGEAIKIESGTDVDAVRINGNDLLAPFGLTNAAAEVDARNNYWNSASGPATGVSQDGSRMDDIPQRPATASAVLGPAITSPFLTSSIQ